MSRIVPFTAVLVFVLLSSGCEERKLVSTTTGSLRVECDESVVNVMRLIADSFQMSYTESNIRIVPVSGREAITNFINDSVRVIVSGRAFNDEELAVLKKYNIEYKSFKCAFDAVAVIGHKDNSQKRLRLGEVDSIFDGSVTRWGRKGPLIDVAIGDLNSSVNEVFKRKILKNKPFTLTATKFESSDSLVKYVASNPNAIGIVGLNWLRGNAEKLTVFALGAPNWRPDSTQPYGIYYTPVQAHVYRNYYPIARPVFMYSREYGFTIADGFIAYVTHTHGQQKFLNEGLVPATQPVRLVETTSNQVH
ncbi:MAG: substrate-binding domain-containing protein [Ignavibacteriae bacterium]|nr:substrate-binding domain-containing protein [Ignavibacteriota bacterium]